MSYVIRVSPSRFGKATWIMEDPMLTPQGVFTETTAKQHATKYPTRAIVTDAALMYATKNPDYIGKLSVQWIPKCGS